MAKDAPPQDIMVIQQELGTLEVADRVFRDAASYAASQVPGVAAVGRGVSGIFRRGGPADAVQLERGLDEIALSIGLTVSYDVCIPDMVTELRQRVKAAVEHLTGYRVRAINVAIDRILPPEPKGRQAASLNHEVPEPPPIPDQE